MTASHLAECVLPFVGGTQGRLCLSHKEFAGNVALLKSLFCFLEGSFSLSTSSGLGDLVVQMVSRESAVLACGSQGRPSNLSEF